MFGKYTEKLREIQKTQRYKNSKYEFMKRGNQFFIAIKNDCKYKEYVDLVNPKRFSWCAGHIWFHDYIGSAYKVYRAWKKLMKPNVIISITPFK